MKKTHGLGYLTLILLALFSALAFVLGCGGGGSDDGNGDGGKAPAALSGGTEISYSGTWSGSDSCSGSSSGTITVTGSTSASVHAQYTDSCDSGGGNDSGTVVFTYSKTGNDTARITLDGSNYSFSMTFTTATRGSYTSVYQEAGYTENGSGTFTLSDPTSGGSAGNSSTQGGSSATIDTVPVGAVESDDESWS